MKKQAHYVKLVASRIFHTKGYEGDEFLELQALLYKTGVSPHPKEVLELNEKQKAIFEKYEAQTYAYYKNEIASFEGKKKKKK